MSIKHREMWSIIINLNESIIATSCVLKFFSCEKLLRHSELQWRKKKRKIWQRCWSVYEARAAETLWEHVVQCFFVPHFVDDNKLLRFSLLHCFCVIGHLKSYQQKCTLHVINCRFVELQFPETNIAQLSARDMSRQRVSKWKIHKLRLPKSPAHGHRGSQVMNFAAYFITNTWGISVGSKACNFMHNERSSVVTKFQRISFKRRRRNVRNICIW